MSTTSSPQPEITIVDAPERQAFILQVDGHPAGQLVYSLSGGAPQLVDLTHTEVDEAFAGQGLAGRLVHGALTALQNRQPAVKVTASCPYAAKWIERHPDEFTSLLPG